MKRWYATRKRLTLFRMKHLDKQIDELGWSAKDIATMGGMYMDRAAHNIKQSVRDWFRELFELFLSIGSPCDRYYPNLF